MKTLWAHDRFPTIPSRLTNVFRTFDFFGKGALGWMTVWNYSWATFAIAAAALAVPPVVLIVRQPRSLVARAIKAIMVPVLSLTLVYGFALVDHQAWWLILPSLSIVSIGFIAFPSWLRLIVQRPSVERGVRTVLVGLALLLLFRWHLSGREPYPWQVDVWRSQMLFEAIVPAPELIGSFNAGIPGFFGSQRTASLDGLVSHDARVAWEERTFDGYLMRHGIRFIADEERALARAQRFTRTRITVKEIASFPLRGWRTGKRVLWEVHASGVRDGSHHER